LLATTTALIVGLMLAPLAAGAQQAAKVPRIGFLYPGTTTAATPRIAALLDGLRGLGYVEGQHLAVVSRVAEGKADRLSPLAAELVSMKVDVILAASSPAVRAARTATTTIPIIALDFEMDPVESGLVASLARPGGNLTGVFLDFPEFAGKWLELLKEAVPRLSRVAVFWDPATAPVQLRAVEAAGKALGLQLQILEVRSPANLEEAFRSASQGSARGLVALSSPVFGVNPKPVADLALRHRLPAIMIFTEFPHTGGLMAYGPNLLDMFRHAGVFVGKVLQGRKPADLPVERPTRFELVVNLKTAKALGLTLPQSILVRADQVLQ
jgi:putative ABC transport system substrate-binding protein